ncbi:MAG: DUF4229 domain-containing protein [Actinomycetes bacterium]
MTDPGRPARRPWYRSVVLAYSLARLVIFFAVTGVLYLVGMRGILLLMVAVVVSGLLAYVLLNRQRDQVAQSLSHRVAGAGARISSRIEAANRVEDEALDAGTGSVTPVPPPET